MTRCQQIVVPTDIVDTKSLCALQENCSYFSLDGTMRHLQVLHTLRKLYRSLAGLNNTVVPSSLPTAIKQYYKRLNRISNRFFNH